MGSSNAMEALFDELGLRYEEAWGHDAGLHRVTTRFLSYLPIDAVVLDCGCGTGKPVGKMIEMSGRTVYGIDVAQKMIDLAQKQVLNGVFKKADMLEFNPHEIRRGEAEVGGFQGIVAARVLFCLSRSQLATMAGKFFEWLTPGGYLMIDVIGADDIPALKPESFDEDGLCVSGLEVMFMGRKISVLLFTRVGWCKLLEDAGFDIVHTETGLSKPPAESASEDEVHYFVVAKKPV